jgi:hypothetical protein
LHTPTPISPASSGGCSVTIAGRLPPAPRRAPQAALRARAGDRSGRDRHGPRMRARSRWQARGGRRTRPRCRRRSGRSALRRRGAVRGGHRDRPGDLVSGAVAAARCGIRPGTARDGVRPRACGGTPSWATTPSSCASRAAHVFSPTNRAIAAASSSDRAARSVVATSSANSPASRPVLTPGYPSTSGIPVCATGRAEVLVHLQRRHGGAQVIRAEGDQAQFRLPEPRHQLVVRHLGTTRTSGRQPSAARRASCARTASRSVSSEGSRTDPMSVNSWSRSSPTAPCSRSRSNHDPPMLPMHSTAPGRGPPSCARDTCRRARRLSRPGPMAYPRRSERLL